MDGASFRKWTEQDPNVTFSQCVRHLLKENGMTAAKLARESRLSKTTISRALRDSDDRGATYRPNEKMVIAISIALKLGLDGYEALREIAFPELIVMENGLKEKKSVDEVNDELYELGLPLLANTDDE